MTTREKSVSKTRQERMPFDAYLTPKELALAICKWLKEKGIGQSMFPNTPFRVLEPSAGHGHFVSAMREVWPNATIIANEVQPRLVPIPVMRKYLVECAHAKKAGIKPELVDGSHNPRYPETPEPTLDTREVLTAAGASVVMVGDFLAYKRETFSPLFNLVGGNPPYTAGGGAAAHVAKAIELLADGGVASQLLKTHFVGTAARIDFWDRYRELLAADPSIIPRPDYTGEGRDTVEYTAFTFHKPLPNGVRWREWRAKPIQWRKDE